MRTKLAIYKLHREWVYPEFIRNCSRLRSLYLLYNNVL